MKTIRIRDVLERELNLLLSRAGAIDEYYSVLAENFNTIDNALNIASFLDSLIK